MDPSISFVIATNGVRERIRETIRNLHAVGKQIGDYEIVVSGNVEKVKKERRVVLVPDPIDLSGPARFVWRSGFETASKTWTAAVADDMILEESWPAAFLAFDAGDHEVVYGDLFGPDGRLWSRSAVENKSILAVVRRELWSRFPLLEVLGEDMIWCKKIRLGGVKWTRCPDLAWRTFGTPRSTGGIGGTYSVTDPRLRRAHNLERKKLARLINRERFHIERRAAV